MFFALISTIYCESFFTVSKELIPKRCSYERIYPWGGTPDSQDLHSLQTNTDYRALFNGRAYRTVTEVKSINNGFKTLYAGGFT